MPSPLRTARQFEQLKSILRRTHSVDTRLLRIAGFWPAIQPLVGNAAYQSFVDEYYSLLVTHLERKPYEDLMPVDFEVIHPAVESALHLAEGRYLEPMIAGRRMRVAEWARCLFHVGAIADGLRVLGIEDTADALDIPDDADAYESFCMVQEAGNGFPPEIRLTLDNIRAQWKVSRNHLSFTEANGLFVEKDERGVVVRGRMCVIRGSAERRSRLAERDEVTFEHQLITGDDPMVGGLYESLAALRTLMSKPTYGGLPDRHLHTHFSIPGNGHACTGNSAGLAAGLITFTQLLKPETLRDERFISGDAAFTGSVAAGGTVVAVNNDTLEHKIRRGFFSPVRHLVLPSGNLEAARKYLVPLERQFPRRRLNIIPVATLRDAIDDRNIIRSERVCMGDFIARKAVRFGRMTKLQVPLLLAAIYVLVCILFPKAWVGFDWNPSHVIVTEGGFSVMNSDSVALWSQELDCPMIDSESRWDIGNLDDDSENEVVFVPKVPANEHCDCNALLHIYDDNGDLINDPQPTYILHQYPGDDSPNHPYAIGQILLRGSGSEAVIRTSLNESTPSRCHLTWFDSRGSRIGWYVCAGSTDVKDVTYAAVDDSTDAFLAYNNRMGCASLLLLPSRNAHGVSPPYTNEGWDLSWVTPGNQYACILFPKSDVCTAYSYQYNGALNLTLTADGKIKVATLETLATEQKSSAFYICDPDSSFRIVTAFPDDLLIQQANALAKVGILPLIDLDSLCENLRNAVMYWTDSGWVTEGRLRKLD